MSANLYGDFVEYLNITFGENDTLEIDVLEIANFNDMPTLIRQMNAMLIAIDAGKPIDHNPFATYDCIDKFTGWDYDCGNEFRHYASVYADYVYEYESIVVAKLEREKLESQNPKKSGGLIKKTLYYAIFVAATIILTAIGLIFRLGFNYFAFSAAGIVFYIWNRDVLIKND